jgi:Ca2+/Na+ antiporter
MLFVDFLRSIATILITNSHYGSVWPSSSLAFGGLLGNVLFFAVSGYCLFNIKQGFGRWYLKRILRVYPVVIGFTLLTVLFGLYPLNSLSDAFRLFVYPTNYIFLVWLMICYVGFYIVAYLDKKTKWLTEKVFGFLILCWLVVYIFFTDKNFYHIDEVSKPFILFLYFSCMLLGGLFRKHEQKFKNVKILNVLFLLLGLVIYFVSKKAFSSIEKISSLQILNQLILVAVVYLTLSVFIGLEEKLKKLPKFITKVAGGLAKITLQIYVVQFVVISKFNHFAFPLNFLVVTVLIIAFATAVYFIEYYLRKFFQFLKSKLGERKNAESID